MTAGLNVRFRIWDMHEEADDYVGGSSISGTCKYDNVQGRFQQLPVSQVFLEQGLETNKVFTAVLVPGTLTVDERDEVELIFPRDHVECGHRFRIVSARPSDHNPRDPRNYLMLQLTRSVVAHAQQ